MTISQEWHSYQFFQHLFLLLMTCNTFTGVVQPLDWYEYEKKFLLVMERTRNSMDLFDLMNSKGPLQERHARKIFRQVRKNELLLKKHLFLSVENIENIPTNNKYFPKTAKACQKVKTF